MKYNVTIKVPQLDNKSNWLKHSILAAIKEQMPRLINMEKLQTGEIKKKAATTQFMTDAETLINNYCDKFSVEKIVVVDYDEQVAQLSALQSKIDAWKADPDFTDVHLMPEYIRAKEEAADIRKVIIRIDLFIGGDNTQKVTEYV